MGFVWCSELWVKDIDESFSIFSDIVMDGYRAVFFGVRINIGGFSACFIGGVRAAAAFYYYIFPAGARVMKLMGYVSSHVSTVCFSLSRISNRYIVK